MLKRCRILFVFGTRPELIKLQSIWDALQHSPLHDQVEVYFTGQHQDLVDYQQARKIPFPLHLPKQGVKRGLSLNALLSQFLQDLDYQLERLNPELVVIQGDTTSAVAGALASFHRQIPVIHVEAGLRTPSIQEPFPEEANRRLISQLASMHFAPTSQAEQNLLDEGISPQDILVTGNTGVDHILQHTDSSEALTAADHEVMRKLEVAMTPQKRMVFMTLHRRENMNHLESLLETLAALVTKYPQYHFVWPRHPNPTIMKTSSEQLGGHAQFTLLPFVSHALCLNLLQRAALVMTDSGGLQEEAITWGKPLLVMRQHTDRPEGLTQGAPVYMPQECEDVEGGFVANTMQILEQLLQELPPAQEISRDVYGDGTAGQRIAEALGRMLTCV